MEKFQSKLSLSYLLQNFYTYTDGAKGLIVAIIFLKTHSVGCILFHFEREFVIF